MMRPITISLDPEAWKLAKKKTNFSSWVRDKLKSERNKMDTPWKYCYSCDKSAQTHHENCVNDKCNDYMVAILEEL